MDPEQQQPTFHAKTYAGSWDQFVDRAMQILVEHPIDARYTIKYLPKKNYFILKVTNGQAIVMRRASANRQFEQVQKFTLLATRALTNESEEVQAEKQVQKGGKDNKKKKNKKR